MNHALKIVPGVTGFSHPAPDEQAVQPQPEPRISSAGILEEGLASAALAMGDFKALLRHCSQLVQKQPDHYQAWFNLGFARHQVGEIEEAGFAYRQAQRLRPDAPEPILNIGLLKHSQADWAGAREAYEHVLRLDASHSIALWNLGLVLEEAGDSPQAEAVFTRLVAAQPDHPQAWFRLGLACYDREDFHAALDAFSHCLRLRQDWPEASYNRAIICLAQQRQEEARAGFEHVLASDPHSAQALLGMAAAAAACGDIEAGLEIRSRLCETGRHHPELTFNLALQLDQRGRSDEAMRLYCEALKERPMFPDALLNLGHLLERQGNREEARECWKRALELNTDFAAGYFSPAP